MINTLLLGACLSGWLFDAVLLTSQVCPGGGL
ncbi:hypothetical protein C7427_11510 [Pantoea ananatis]|nr:hypothetical protein C7427_11510 [Pantoea ananatis]